MWANVGGVLVNLSHLCYVRFEEYDGSALATLHFKDRVDPISFSGGSPEELRLVFSELLGVRDEQGGEEIRPEASAES